MAVSEDGKKWLLGQWAASWRTLTEAWGLAGFLCFLNEPETSERLVNETYRTLEKERMESRRFDRTRDMPSLLEFKAVYHRINREQRAITDVQNLPECEFCQSTGRRWMVTATDDLWSNEEVILAVVDDVAYGPGEAGDPRPIANDDFRKYATVSSIPCTCQRGDRVVRWAVEKRPHARVMSPQKRHAILSANGFTHTHKDAQKICSEYRRISNFHNKKIDPFTLKPCALHPVKDDSFAQMAKAVLKQASIWAEERRNKRGRFSPELQVQDAQM